MEPTLEPASGLKLAAGFIGDLRQRYLPADTVRRRPGKFARLNVRRSRSAS